MHAEGKTLCNVSMCQMEIAKNSLDVSQEVDNVSIGVIRPSSNSACRPELVEGVAIK